MEPAPSSTTTQPPQTQHEPISFGIDQILSGSDPENSTQQPNTRDSDTIASSYHLGSPASTTTAPYSLPGQFPGIGSPFEDSGCYSVNLSLAPAGVIRVPAHRPIPGAVPPPITSAMPTVPGFGSLNFPWMESTRRFAKDRFTGKGIEQALLYSLSILLPFTITTNALQCLITGSCIIFRLDLLVCFYV